MAEITVENLNFRYQAGRELVLNQVNFQPDEGKFTLIMGPSGSGKSTLLKVMAGLYPQYGGEIVAGQVTLDGQSVGNLVPYERAQRIAMLFQHAGRQFAMPTALEQLTFSMENLQYPADVIRERIPAIMKELNIWDLRHRKLMTLSGGEQQRVALANVLAMDSEIILLDEPFANVDPAGRQGLLQILKTIQLEQHKTIILTDHEQTGYHDLVDAVYFFDEQNQMQPAMLNQLQDNIPALNWSASVEVANGLLGWRDLGMQVGERYLLNAPYGELPQGKLGLLAGANGVGKSTFLKALAHQQKYEGQVLFEQVATERLKMKNWAQKLGLNFQLATDQFVGITVAEEITLAQQHSYQPGYWNAQKVQAKIEQLNISAVREQSVYQLSGGQQKKVQILTSLIMAQSILLFDEPLAGLDYASAQTVLSLMKETIAELNLTGLMVSHQRESLPGFVDYELELAEQQLQIKGGIKWNVD